MTTTTLDWLSEIGETPDKFGNVYVNMKFGDGTIAYKAGKPSDMEKHHHALSSFADSNEPHEFEFEATDKKTQKGEPKFKLVGYPGWTAMSQGGGGGGGGSSWYNSEEGVRFTQEKTDRRTALMQAVEWAAHLEMSGPGTIQVAQTFYEWLRESPVHSGPGESLGDSTAATTTRGHATSSPSREQQAPGAYGEGTSGACSHVFKGGKCKFCGEPNPWA